MRAVLPLLTLVLVLGFLPSADAWWWGRRRTTPSTRPTTGGSIPASCYSPSGTDCNWYANCLEKKIPCRNRDGDYAMAYATTYCSRYTARSNSFSPAGRVWVNAVKKCLQEKLVPLLRRTPAPTCPTIKREAFASHVPCYVNPTGAGTPSFCDLSLGDKWEVFRTIYSAFGSEFVETVKGGLQTSGKCWF